MDLRVTFSHNNYDITLMLILGSIKWVKERRLPFPVTLQEAFTYYLDITTPPTPQLLQQFQKMVKYNKRILYYILNFFFSFRPLESWSRISLRS